MSTSAALSAGIDFEAVKLIDERLKDLVFGYLRRLSNHKKFKFKKKKRKNRNMNIPPLVQCTCLLYFASVTDTFPPYKIKKPRKKQSIAFEITAIIFIISILILYAISSDYNDALYKVNRDDYTFSTQLFIFYSMFQDIHAMMIVGFAFSMTFLRRYAFSAVSFNLMICVFTIPWGVYIFNMIGSLFTDNVGILELTTYTLITGDIASCVVLITFGCLIGRLNPRALLIIAFMEPIFWSINYYICVEYIGVFDIGGSILIYIFATYFGLAVSWIIGVPKHNNENKSMYHSEIFAMFGTLLLWIHFPSFNAYYAIQQNPYDEYHIIDRIFVNTVFSLCGSTVSTFVVSNVLRIIEKGVSNGKFNIVHIQNSTLSGGVAIACLSDLYLYPWGAIFIGLISGIISVCGYYYLSDLITDKLNIPDIRGIHNVYGLPAVLGGIISSFVISYGNKQDIKQGGLQIAVIIVTLLLSVVSGLITAFGVRCIDGWSKREFLDVENFHLGARDIDFDYFRVTIRDGNDFGRRLSDDELDYLSDDEFDDDEFDDDEFDCESDDDSDELLFPT